MGFWWEDSFELTPVYFIGLLNFEIERFKDQNEYLHHGKIVDIHTNQIMYDKLNMIYLEIPKLKKTKEELSNHLEWWIYVFQNLHMMNDIPSELNGDIIQNTFDRAEFANMPKSEQENYHKNLKVYRDLVNSFDFAIKEGFREGQEKGREEGIEQGIEQGVQKGKEEERIEIAKNLLDVLDNKTIAIKTGLSIEIIEQLRNKKK